MISIQNDPGLRKGPRGFTLVELLVVVSIVTLLIAMLLPALSQARAAGFSARCGVNLHQMSVALEAYRSDWKEYYAPMYAGVRDTGGFYTRPFTSRLAYYMNGHSQFSNGRINSGVDTGRKGRHVFYCPAAPLYTISNYQYPLRYDAWLNGPSWDYNIATYNMLSSIGYNDTDTSPWMKLKRSMLQPRNTMVYTDGYNQTRIDHSYRYQKFRHLDSANILMGDYSVINENETSMPARWAQPVFHGYDPQRYRYLD